jgi:3-methylcrotonyl-CoA carboxylase alpha subunit
VKVIRTGEGTYRVEHDGRISIVYVAGPPGEEWAFWNGEVFQRMPRSAPARARRESRTNGVQIVTAPMAAKVAKVLVGPGEVVRKGQTLVVLEAMKMELPIRSAGDASVSAVHCREGERVQHDAVLVELR